MANTGQEGWTHETLLAHLTSVINEIDRRHDDKEKGILITLEEGLENHGLLHAAQVEALRQHVTSQVAEVKAAVESANKLNDSIRSASDKAVDKAEAAQAAYNARSNEFRAALDDANKQNMQRTEALGLIASLSEKIDAVKTSAEAARGLLKASSDERLENLNKRLAAMDLLLTGMLKITDYDTRHAELQRQVEELRRASERGAGAATQSDKATSNERYVLGIVLTFVVILVSAVISVAARLLFK